MGDTSTCPECQTGREGYERRGLRFCTKLYFWELLGDDKVSRIIPFCAPTGSPGNGSGDKVGSMVRGVRRSVGGFRGRVAVGRNRSWREGGTNGVFRAHDEA